MVEEHTFREDLFFRINIINLHLPPLRERREDIPLLVDYFLRLACAANKLPCVKVSADAIAYLQTLPFTGNIRELKNLVERALLMKTPNTGVLEAEDFQLGGGAANATLSPSGETEGNHVSLSSMERSAVAACIARNNGNLSLVAKELGISRGALYRKIEKYGL
jgi:two-component system NtrC family response regulator